MVRVNFEREFGLSLGRFSLPVERPTVCDNRMMPFAWLRGREDKWLKFDAGSHGDDHFFPGPCDIAWDLAGAIVEWELPNAARDLLLREYRRTSGDDASLRLVNYEIAYGTFRMAWSAMAAASVEDGEEKHRLLGDYRRYRLQVRRASLNIAAGQEAQTELPAMQPSYLL
jgi:hypothetical protein